MRSRKKPDLQTHEISTHEHKTQTHATWSILANAADRARLITQFDGGQRSHAHSLHAQIADATAVETEHT